VTLRLKYLLYPGQRGFKFKVSKNAFTWCSAQRPATCEGLKIAQCSEAVIEGLKLLGAQVACFCMNINLEMVGIIVTLLNTVGMCVCICVCVCVYIYIYIYIYVLSLIIHSCMSLSMTLPELCRSV
jgi:hypothetical protein